MLVVGNVVNDAANNAVDNTISDAVDNVVGDAADGTEDGLLMMPKAMRKRMP